MLGIQAAVVIVLAAAPLPAPSAGTVTGRLAWPDGAAVPENPEAKVIRNAEYILAKGPIRVNELIVHPKSRGIANGVFFLTDAADALKKLPLRKRPAKAAEIDTPRGEFVPRITVLAPGQELVVKNGSPVPQDVRIDGPLYAVVNRLLTAETSFTLAPLDPSLSPHPVRSSIHPWMGGYVFAPPSGYSAVTGADGRFVIESVPKGTYRLIGWHERTGWIFPRPGPGKPPGTIIEVKERGTTDLGKIERRPPD